MRDTHRQGLCGVEEDLLQVGQRKEDSARSIRRDSYRRPHAECVTEEG
jgi:hypothetical protein